MKEAKMGGNVAMAICRGKRKANKKVFAEIEEEALKSYIDDAERNVLIFFPLDRKMKRLKIYFRFLV